MTAKHGLIVAFYSEPVHMPFKSEEAGRPIYEDRDHIRIIIPGDRNSIVERLATDEDRKKYDEEYSLFKAGADEDGQMSGTPLSQWAAIRPALAKEFQAQNIRTVEQLASLNDSGKQAFGMGALEWSAKARAYLDQAASSGAVEKYAAENVALRGEVAALKAEFAALSARVEGRASRKREVEAA
jgi:hypothetical protein